MVYAWFLSYLRRLTANYDRIKIPNIQDDQYSAIGRIPDTFIMLLDDVLPVVNDNIQFICPSDDQVMMLFGLQPCAGMYYEEEDHEHFCCTLDYYLCTFDKLMNGQHKHVQTLTVIIDFTSGEILTANDYAESYIANHRKNVKPLGNIPLDALDNAWKTLSRCNDNASTEVNDKYLKTYLYLKNLRELNTTHTSSNNITADISQNRTILIRSNDTQSQPHKKLSEETIIEFSFFNKKTSYSKYLSRADLDATYSESKLRKIGSNVLADCDDISTKRQMFRQST